MARFSSEESENDPGTLAVRRLWPVMQAYGADFAIQESLKEALTQIGDDIYAASTGDVEAIGRLGRAADDHYQGNILNMGNDFDTVIEGMKHAWALEQQFRSPASGDTSDPRGPKESHRLSSRKCAHCHTHGSIFPDNLSDTSSVVTEDLALGDVFQDTAGKIYRVEGVRPGHRGKIRLRLTDYLKNMAIGEHEFDGDEGWHRLATFRCDACGKIADYTPPDPDSANPYEQWFQGIEKDDIIYVMPDREVIATSYVLDIPPYWEAYDARGYYRVMADGTVSMYGATGSDDFEYVGEVDVEATVAEKSGISSMPSQDAINSFFDGVEGSPPELYHDDDHPGDTVFPDEWLSKFKQAAVNPVNYEGVPLTDYERGLFDDLPKAEKQNWHHRAKNYNHRARKLDTPGKVTGRELFGLSQRYEGQCAYCDKSLEWDPTLQPQRNNQDNAGTFDHNVPLAKGGHNIAENVVPACWSCNKDMNQWDLRIEKGPKSLGITAMEHILDVPDHHPHNPWVDKEGDLLEEGVEYEMHSHHYDIPDRITVEEITPAKLIYITHSGDIDYRNEIAAKDVDTRGYIFHRADEDELDSETDPSTRVSPVRPGHDALPQTTDISDLPTHVSANMPYSPAQIRVIMWDWKVGDDPDDSDHPDAEQIRNELNLAYEAGFNNEQLMEPMGAEQGSYTDDYVLVMSKQPLTWEEAHAFYDWWDQECEDPSGFFIDPTANFLLDFNSPAMQEFHIDLPDLEGGVKHKGIGSGDTTIPEDWNKEGSVKTADINNPQPGEAYLWGDMPLTVTAVREDGTIIFEPEGAEHWQGLNNMSLAFWQQRVESGEIRDIDTPSEGSDALGWRFDADWSGWELYYNDEIVADIESWENPESPEEIIQQMLDAGMSSEQAEEGLQYAVTQAAENGFALWDDPNIEGYIFRHTDQTPGDTTIPEDWSPERKG